MNIGYHIIVTETYLSTGSSLKKILGLPVFQLTQLLPRNDKLIRTEYLQRADGFK